MHPGICPEYRNAYGCFWALAEDDLERVGMTLLKVDAGIDTGGVYGYYTYDYDEVNESQNMIHNRVTFDNLPELAEKILEIDKGSAQLIDTSARNSATWGQPWLSRYFRWKKMPVADCGSNRNETEYVPLPRRHQRGPLAAKRFSGLGGSIYCRGMKSARRRIDHLKYKDDQQTA